MTPLAADFAEERNELQAILTSGIFHRAPNLAHVLTYVCEKYFEGAAEQIKEYNIAVEALGRPAGFDQKRDSIVRVEAHRLRKRLRDYYEAEGSSHAVRIEIPPGQYAPHFLRRDQQAADPRDRAMDEPRYLALTGTMNLQRTQAESDMAVQPAPEMDPPGFIPSSPLALPPPPPRNRRGMWIGVSLAAACLLGLLIWKLPAAGHGSVAASLGNGAGALTSQPEIRILTGLENGSYTDRFGRVWQSDRYFHGGTVFESASHVIIGARDSRLFRSRREGAFTYDIPVQPGVYELRLYFAETLYGENNVAGGGETSRIFDVFVNGAHVLNSFDVIGEVGASAADVRAFRDIAPESDGEIHLRFDPQINPAMVSAIEIAPGIPGRMRPIRIVSRDHPYTDKQGRTWAADDYSRGGQLVMRQNPISNIDDPELLHGERYGNLSYSIPVPPGRYGLVLYFSESWFGPGNFAGGGVGSRVFDIFCNGEAVRRGFDVFKEAGGSDRALVLPIHGLEPTPQGKIEVRLRPSRNYASLNALELIDESR